MRKFHAASPSSPRRDPCKVRSTPREVHMKMISAREGKKTLPAPLPVGPALVDEVTPTGAADVVSGSRVGIAHCPLIAASILETLSPFVYLWRTRHER